MFNFKRQPKPLTEEEYQVEYRKLLRQLGQQFAVGDGPWDQVVNAMGILAHEMNGNGGVNWTETGYTEFLDALRQHLTAEARFTPEQLAKICWSLDEITTCGQELVEHGESARSATEAVDYLILRVVDWCRWNPKADENA